MDDAARSVDPCDVPDADPEVSAHVMAIRDRFGVRGLRAAARLIEVEIALAEDALRELGGGADRSPGPVG